jgi:hypothetical protein
MYMDDSTYSIDYYDEIDSPAYVEVFRKTWNMSQEDPRYQTDLRLRSKSFYFTQCPHCKVTILTNRDIGKSLTCRSCDTSHATVEVVDKARFSLLVLIDGVVGRARNQKISVVNVLLCQHSNPQTLAIADSICQKAGFSRVSDKTPIAIWLLRGGVERGTLRIADRFSTWRISAQADSGAYEDMTPPEFEQLLRQLRTRCEGIQTVSSSVDPASTQGAAMLGSIEDYMKVLGEVPDDALQLKAERFLAAGDLNSAGMVAERLLSVDSASAPAYQLLGRVAARAQNWSVAIDHLQRAPRLDPTDKDTLALLFACCQRAGRPSDAARAASDLARLGGRI